MPVLRVAARSGAVAALAGVVTAVVVAVLCWLPDAGVSGRAGSAIKAGLLSFGAAQHGGITVNGVPAQFLPLGMMLIVAFFAWRAGQTIAESITEQVPAGRLIAPVLVGAAVYAGGCALVAFVSRLGTSHLSILTAPVAGFVLFAVVAGIALGVSLQLELPPWLLGAGRGAVMATALYLAAGAVLVAGSLVLHAHRVTQISGEVGGGISGLPVLVIGLLCAPNAAIAGSAYLAGPGFAVGTGTTVNAFSTSHGVLPALPVFGAIPDGHGANPVVLALMSLVPLVAAVCVARAVRRTGPPGFLRRLGCAALSGAFTGVAMASAVWLGGGRAGTGRLRAVGASAWQVGFAVAAVVAVLGVLAIAALGAWDRFVTADPPSGGAAGDPGVASDPGDPGGPSEGADAQSRELAATANR